MPKLGQERQAKAWGCRRHEMPGIVEFPEVVRRAIEQFGSVFPNEPARRHFGEYLTGLFVAASKTVSGISREFAVPPEQSTLNRWLTESPWDSQQLNAARLAWLQQDPSTRYSRRGAIAIDNTLIDHAGMLIQDVGYFWDHSQERNTIAHDYLIAGYVTTAAKQFPLEFRRFRKREDCDALMEHLRSRPGGLQAAHPREIELATFRSHTALCIDLIDWVVGNDIPGDFTWDSYFSNAEIMNHTHGKDRAYVGDLKQNRKIMIGGVTVSASDYASTIPMEDRKLVTANGRRQYYFTVTCHVPDVDHKVRILILWKYKRSKVPAKILVTNRTIWEVTRILELYGKRWTGTETFHRDGKQHLGMGDCQLRSGEGQTRHMYLVFLAHSLLAREMLHGRPHDLALEYLTTIGEAPPRQKSVGPPYARRLDFGARLRAALWIRCCISSVRTSRRSSIGSDAPHLPSSFIVVSLTHRRPSPGSPSRLSCRSSSAKAAGKASWQSWLPQRILT